jgi:hypothetical protein
MMMVWPSPMQHTMYVLNETAICFPSANLQAQDVLTAV